MDGIYDRLTVEIDRRSRDAVRALCGSCIHLDTCCSLDDCEALRSIRERMSRLVSDCLRLFGEDMITKSRVGY